MKTLIPNPQKASRGRVLFLLLALVVAATTYVSCDLTQSRTTTATVVQTPKYTLNGPPAPPSKPIYSTVPQQWTPVPTPDGH